MNLDWFFPSNDVYIHVILSTIAFYITLIVAVKVHGLRTFAKMSSFDFAITVAIGSLFAATIVTEKPAVFQGVTALVTLLVLQSIVAGSRVWSEKAEDLVDNCPLLLMDGTKILEDNLTKGQVTLSDLKGKLREANVLRLCQVKAVVLEATGDISVLHTSDAEIEIEEDLLEGVSRN